MKIKISYIKLETYIFKHNGSKSRSIHFFHEILRVDDQRPKTPLVLNMKMYIKLVHNPGRDDCTCINFKKKGRSKKPKTTGTSMKRQIKVNFLRK